MSETPKPRACYMRHGKVYDAQLKYVNATPAVAITRTAYDEVRDTLVYASTLIASDKIRAALHLLPEIPE